MNRFYLFFAIFIAVLDLYASNNVIVVKEVFHSINVLPGVIDLEEGTAVQLQAFGRYDNGEEKDITEKVQWKVADTWRATVDANGTLSALREGSTSLSAALDKVEARKDVTVYKVMHGHRLPPKPHPIVNNATLLGIDSNNNGVRDDVERWIYTRYDKHIPCKFVPNGNITLPDGTVLPASKEVCAEKEVPYHQIVREIAMQFGRAAQIVIQEPEKARETMKFLDDAVDCSSYFTHSSNYPSPAEKNNESIYLDHYIFGDEFKNIQFNTVKRARAFAKYNMALSGGVYGGVSDEEARSGCDFNVTKLLQEP